MFRFTIAAMTALTLLAGGCKIDSKTNTIEEPAVVAPDGVIHVGNQRIVGIECGQVCVIVYDDENNAFVAHMEDGRTVTFSLNE